MNQSTGQNGTLNHSITANENSFLEKPTKCLIPLEIVRNLLIASDANNGDRDWQTEESREPSEEIVKEIAAVCHIMAHDMLERAAKAAHDLDRTEVFYDDVDKTWPFTMVDF